MLDIDRTAIDAERSRAAVEVARIRRAMLADMPQGWVARQLSTEALRAELGRRGYYVEPPRGWPRMADDDEPASLSTAGQSGRE
jgi:hypothetical protein